MSLNQIPQSNPKSIVNLFLLIAGLMAAASLYVTVASTMWQATGQEVPGGGGNVVQARLGKGTESLLKQTAMHMSKLLGGESIGRFPGFEPPDDDKRYKDKIRNQAHSGEEINYWVKEINNFLQQVVKKNPNMTIEKILKEMGWQQSEIESFIDALQRFHSIVRGNLHNGVSQITLDRLESLMAILGVPTW